ncbi:MAG: hypothetical protein IKI81_03885, partial [Selenomonadaceae bacterium]|nr:hypothetical protein [Selenomonadaceae bacterium]
MASGHRYVPADNPAQRKHECQKNCDQHHAKQTNPSDCPWHPFTFSAIEQEEKEKQQSDGHSGHGRPFSGTDPVVKNLRTEAERGGQKSGCVLLLVFHGFGENGVQHLKFLHDNQFLTVVQLLPYEKIFVPIQIQGQGIVLRIPVQVSGTVGDGEYFKQFPVKDHLYYLLLFVCGGKFFEHRVAHG